MGKKEMKNSTIKIHSLKNIFLDQNQDNQKYKHTNITGDRGQLKANILCNYFVVLITLGCINPSPCNLAQWQVGNY